MMTDEEARALNLAMAAVCGYPVLLFVGDWQDVEAFLNRMAIDGWEFVSFAPAGRNSYCCVFRRAW